MEKLTTTAPSKTSWIKWIILATALGLCTISCSCWGPTEKDVADQQQKLEKLSYQISQYINSRKDLVAKYNTLLAYPKTDANKHEINKSLIQIWEKICEYDEKLSDLAKDKIDAESDLSNYIANLKIKVSPNEPIDPNKRDFLLTIQ